MWDACSLQYTAAAQRVFRADRNAKYARLTILDKEAGAVHYDEDDERMYLGARACHRLVVMSGRKALAVAIIVPLQCNPSLKCPRSTDYALLRLLLPLQ